MTTTCIIIIIAIINNSSDILIPEVATVGPSTHEEDLKLKVEDEGLNTELYTYIHFKLKVRMC